MLKKFTLNLDNKYDVCLNHFYPSKKNHLFNEPDYFNIHSSSSQDVYAQLVRRSDLKVFATICFYEDTSGIFLSPIRGTFGSVSLNENLGFLLLDNFLTGLIHYLVANGARELRIKCAPSSHDNALFSKLFSIFTRNNLIPDYVEVNYDLLINDRNFIDLVDYGNIKRIRKMLKCGFVAEKIGNTSLSQAYLVIAENRSRLGVVVSMTENQLKNMIDRFPDAVHLFAVYRDSQRTEILASAVCIAITDSILYVLYWGDAADMGSYSPVALLAKTIYEYCQENGFKLLDVGTSTLKGIPNFGLVKFKQNLGFAESLKVEFSTKDF